MKKFQASGGVAVNIDIEHLPVYLFTLASTKIVILYKDQHQSILLQYLLGLTRFSSKAVVGHDE